MAVLLALSASLLWGVGDFLGGVASRRVPAGRVLLAGQVAGLVAFLLVVDRVGLPAAVAHLPGSAVLVAAGAGVAWLVGLACFYRGCAMGSMGIVAPVAATGVLVPVVVGLWSGQRPAALQTVGIVAAVAGVVLCSTSTGEEQAERRAERLAATYGAAAALGFGIELALLNRLSGSTDEDATMLVVRGAALTVLVVGTLAARLHRSAPVGLDGAGDAAPSATVRPGWRTVFLVVAIGIADVAAMSMFVRSGDEGSLSTVAVLASLYPAVTVALGRLVAGDSIHRAQRIGLAAVLLGASMVAVP